MSDKTAPEPNVVKGQLWQDCDKRCQSRTLRIDEVCPDGYCENARATKHWGVPHAHVTAWWAISMKPASNARIRLDRFRPNSTGYRLVREP